MISIIVVNWNGKNWLSKCLPSIYGQDYGDFEVILVDNGSTDGSAAYVGKAFPDAKVIRLARNYGFIIANNLAVRHAKGDYIILLNNDTYAYEGWLKSLVRCADENPDYKILASLQCSDEGICVGFDVGVYGAVRLLRPRPGEELMPSLFASGACLLIRRDWLDALGYLFDPSYGSFAEDLDLSLRTVLAGGKIGYVAKSRIYHRIGGTWGRIRDFKPDRLIARNEILTYYRLLGFGNFLKMAIARAIFIAQRLLIAPQECAKSLAMALGLLEALIRLPLHRGAKREFKRKKARPDGFLLRRLRYRPENFVERALWRFLNSSKIPRGCPALPSLSDHVAQKPSVG